MTKVRLGEVGAAQVRAVKIGERQVGRAVADAIQDSAPKIDPGLFRAPEHQTALGVGGDEVVQIAPPSLGFDQVQAREQGGVVVGLVGHAGLEAASRRSICSRSSGSSTGLVW